MTTKENKIYEPEYEKVKLIGSGTFGMVWKCRNKRTSAIFALKHLRFTTSLMKSIETELKILSEIAVHKNLIKYYGQKCENNGISIFMEFLSLGSLKDIINSKGVLNEITAGKYTKEILEGLAFLHENNVIHRDIKCGNILLNEQDHVKLTDFGLSKCVQNNSILDQHTFCGTLNFMAPEILMKNVYSSSVDIWAVGVTVIEMLTSRPIYPDLHLMELINKLKDNKPISTGIRNPSKRLSYFLKLTFIRKPNFRPKADDLIQTKFILNAYK